MEELLEKVGEARFRRIYKDWASSWSSRDKSVLKERFIESLSMRGISVTDMQLDMLVKYFTGCTYNLPSKTIYLVDCENVGTRRKAIGEDDYIYYFSSNNGYAWAPLKSNEKEIHVTHTGSKNALDMCIDSYLGKLIAEHGNSYSYYIVSRDTGFDVVCAFWQPMGYNVGRIEDLNPAISVPKDEYLDHRIEQLLSQFEYLLGTSKAEVLIDKVGDLLLEEETLCLIDCNKKDKVTELTGIINTFKANTPAEDIYPDDREVEIDELDTLEGESAEWDPFGVADSEKEFYVTEEEEDYFLDDIFTEVIPNEGVFGFDAIFARNVFDMSKVAKETGCYEYWSDIEKLRNYARVLFNFTKEELKAFWKVYNQWSYIEEHDYNLLYSMFKHELKLKPESLHALCVHLVTQEVIEQEGDEN